jgi:hypothetical protein
MFWFSLLRAPAARHYFEIDNFYDASPKKDRSRSRMRTNNGRAQRCRASHVITYLIRYGSRLVWRAFGGIPERGSINWTDFEQRWHHIAPIVHLEAFDGVGLGLFDLTLKVSETVAWRGACESMIRDKQSASLHRFVRLIFHFWIKYAPSAITVTPIGIATQLIG